MREASIFAAAIEKTGAEERAAYLDLACAGDEKLRRRVEALLRAHAEPDELLDMPESADRTAAHGPFIEELGTIIGPYKLLQKIGEGGFGVVFMAEQQQPLRRMVALKIIKLGMDTAQVIARFESERQALALMDHPHIAKVLDAGATESGRPYFVMELVKGVPITEFCDKNHLPPDARLKLFLDVCHAIQHAHHKGIIHRDIKPTNVMVTLHDGVPVVKVIDFGVAKATAQKLTERTLFTAYGQMVGTPAYMSPEQAEMSGLDIDTRSDVYSLGVLLYELLTGTTPLESKHLRAAGYVEMQRLIREVEAPRPSTRLSSLGDSATVLAGNRGLDVKGLTQLLSGDLDWVVMKSLAKDRNRRYSTPGTMAEDIDRYLRREAILARPPSTSYRLKKFAQRNRAAMLTAALVALALCAGTAVATWQAISATHARLRAVAAAQAETKAKEQAQAAERRAAAHRASADAQAAIATREADQSRRLLYAADMHLAQQAWEAGNIERARSVLEEHVPEAGQNDLRGFEWRCLWSLCRDASRYTLRGHTAGITSIAFAPNGRTIATCGDDSSLRLWDLATRQHIKFTGPRFRLAVFAPDGNTVATADFGNLVRLWDLAGRREQAALPHSANVGSLAFSPDGTLLAAGCEDGTICLWNALKRQEVGILRGHTQQLPALAFSPDGSMLASACFDNTVRLWDVGARASIAKLEGHTAGLLSIAFSPDGTLASASIDNTVRLWDTATKRCVTILRAAREVMTAVAFSPDGKLLATGGGDGAIRIWDPFRREVVDTLRGHTANIRALAFGPDGQTLVSGSWDGTVKVWDVAIKHDPNVLPDQRPSFGSLSFASDGKTLAVGDNPSGTIKLWDVSSHEQVGILPGHKGAVECVSFAPDGPLLASGGGDGMVRLWDVNAKIQIKTFQHLGSTDSLAFSPNGKWLAASAGGFGGTALVWDRATGQEVVRLRPGYRVQFSPDGTLLAVGALGTVQLIDVSTWRSVGVLQGHTAGISCLAFAPDGLSLAVGESEGALWLWDVAQRRLVDRRKVVTTLLTALAFSPDGRRLVSSGADSLVRFWDVAALRGLAALSGDDRPDARTARDKLWASAWVGTLTGHDGPAASVAFSPDGNTLATGGNDATVRLWTAPPLSATVPEPAKPASATPPEETIRLSSLELSGSAQAKLTAEGANGCRIDVTAVDAFNWHVRLSQTLLDLEQGSTYQIRFRAKADSARTILLYAQVQEPDYHGIGLNQVVSLATDWRTLECKFQAKDLGSMNMLRFIVGAQTGTVWIADVNVTKESRANAPAKGK